MTEFQRLVKNVREAWRRECFGSMPCVLHSLPKDPAKLKDFGHRRERYVLGMPKMKVLLQGCRCNHILQSSKDDLWAS